MGFVAVVFVVVVSLGCVMVLWGVLPLKRAFMAVSLLDVYRSVSAVSVTIDSVSPLSFVSTCNSVIRLLERTVLLVIVLSVPVGLQPFGSQQLVDSTAHKHVTPNNKYNPFFIVIVNMSFFLM